MLFRVQICKSFYAITKGITLIKRKSHLAGLEDEALSKHTKNHGTHDETGMEISVILTCVMKVFPSYNFQAGEQATPKAGMSEQAVATSGNGDQARHWPCRLLPSSVLLFCSLCTN